MSKTTNQHSPEARDRADHSPLKLRTVALGCKQTFKASVVVAMQFR